MENDNNNNIEKLLEENLKLNQQMHQDMLKVKRFMFWRLVFVILGFVVVILPIVIAIIWLPPFVRQFYGQYQELIGQGQGAMDLMKQLNQLR